MKLCRKFLVCSVVLLFLAWFCLGQASFAHAQPAEGDAPSARKDVANPAVRMTAEVGFSLLFGTAAGGAGLITGLVVHRESPVPGLVAGALLYPAGVASGVILGGYLTDSKSSYWAPFVGAYAGAAIADLTAYFLADDYPVFSAVLVLALPVVMSMLATETSHYRRNRASGGTARVSMPLSFGFSF
ncbi:MAG: hypothetical protein FWC40_09575 [Proteobacteria bacterium]|nr:hypothetical protein [Pseudomonadota bacterium]